MSAVLYDQYSRVSIPLLLVVFYRRSRSFDICEWRRMFIGRDDLSLPLPLSLPFSGDLLSHETLRSRAARTEPMLRGRNPLLKVGRIIDTKITFREGNMECKAKTKTPITNESKFLKRIRFVNVYYLYRSKRCVIKKEKCEVIFYCRNKNEKRF